MKAKYSVIPFIPVAALMIVFKLMGIFGLDDNGLFLGMNKMTLSYACIGISIGLFVICLILSLIDKKTAPVYPVHKNPAAGILSVLAGASIIASAISGFLASSVNSEYYYMVIICLVSSILAGLAFVFIAKVHFTGKSAVSNVSTLFIFPSLWACTELVNEFLAVTKMSISSTDLTALFCYIFIILFLFSNSMVLSCIKGRNPVNSCFVYGLPAVALGLSNGLYVVFTSFVEGVVLSNLLVGIQLIAISLYAISFIIEMTVKSYTKDEIEIIDGLPDDDNEEKSNYVGSKDYDDLVFAKKDGNGESTDEPVDEYYENANDFEDFIIGYTADPNKQVMDAEEAEAYIPSIDEDIAFAAVLPDEEVEIEAMNEEIHDEEVPFVPDEAADDDYQDSDSKQESDAEAKTAAEIFKSIYEDPKAEEASEAADEPQEELSEIEKILRELDSKK